MPISELCRREGIATGVYYTWLKDFMEAGKARLKGDSIRSANGQEVRQLREELIRDVGEGTKNGTTVLQIEEESSEYCGLLCETSTDYCLIPTSQIFLPLNSPAMLYPQ